MGLEQPKLLGAKGSRDSAWLPDAEVYLYVLSQLRIPFRETHLTCH